MINDASSMKWGITSTVDVVVDVDGTAFAEGSSSSSSSSSSSTIILSWPQAEELNKHKRTSES